MKQKTLKKSSAASAGRRTRNITAPATKHAGRLDPSVFSALLGTGKGAEAPAAEVVEAGEQLLHFFKYHPSERVSRNLRRMMMEFLMTDGGIEAGYLKDWRGRLSWRLERFEWFAVPRSLQENVWRHDIYVIPYSMFNDDILEIYTPRAYIRVVGCHFTKEIPQ